MTLPALGAGSQESKIFTGMLTRDPFAIANLTYMTVYIFTNFQLLCSCVHLNMPSVLTVSLSVLSAFNVIFIKSRFYGE